MTDVSTFLSGHKPRTRTVELCPDTELLSEIVRLHAEARQVAQTDNGSLAESHLDDLNARLEGLRDQAERSQYRFTVRSVGRSIWSTLVDANQPDDDKRTKYRKHGAHLDWDPDTFPPVAVAASLEAAVSPDGDTLTFDAPRFVDGDVQADPQAVELAQRVWDEFEFGETTKLWNAVVDLNVGTPQVPKAVSVSGVTRASQLRSVPPETTESLAPSSSDGSSLAG